MESGSFSVMLNLYDLSNGMAKQFGKALVGMNVDGIWHSGIVIYGKEFYYGGGICTGAPKQTPYGRPVQEIPLGNTEIPEDLFMDFLAELSPGFTMEKYDLFNNNCNNFADECAKFLLGTGIPSFITGLPQQFLQTPMGKMLRPMIDGMKNNIIQNSNPLNLPGQFEGMHNPQTLFGSQGQANNQAPSQQQPSDTNPFAHLNLGAMAGLGGMSGGMPVGSGGSEEDVAELSTLAELSTAMQKNKAFVVDCFSNTCPPCVRIKPIYESIARSYKTEAPGMKFYKCNVHGPGNAIGAQFQIKAIPTFLFFYEGTVIERLQGADESRLRTLVANLASKLPKVPQFQLFNPKQRDLFRFSDKFDLPVSKIKGLLESNATFKEKDNTAFAKFSSNIEANVKSYPQEDKKALFKWLIGYLEVTPKEEFIPFFDLWRLLLSEDGWLALYAHEHQSHVEQILSDLQVKEKEFSRASRVFCYRSLTNLFHVGAGKYLIKKHLPAVTEIALGGLTRYREDKTAVLALTWLTYNIAVAQNDVQIKEDDVTKYLDAMIYSIEKEKDERVLHGAIVAIINFVYEKSVRMEYVRRKHLVDGPLKEHLKGSNELLKSAIEDLVIALGK
jgi:thiol-disulfide isomerase/thioredoxin